MMFRAPESISLRWLATFGRRKTPASPPWALRRLSSTDSRVSDPLRILFCGSDAFSCASLSALYKLHTETPDLVKSIDVVVRPPKPTGRGMKTLQHVPVQTLATQLGLPIWERDTFTFWDMPKPDGEDINLIVAVSFGLWIPTRMIEQAKYGGLNVHPSLLPDLRGAAPLHHTILHGLTHTGVTLQTLSTEAFDEGTRLLQVPPSPGLAVPKDATPDSLLRQVTPLAVDALVTGIQRGLHVPPHKDAGWWTRPPIPPPVSKRDKKLMKYHRKVIADEAAEIGSINQATFLKLAPKIKKGDQRIVWTKSWSATQLHRQWRAFGGLWTRVAPLPEAEKAPFLQPWIKRVQLVTFIALAKKRNLREAAVRQLSRNEKWIREAVVEGRSTAKTPVKKWNVDFNAAHLRDPEEKRIFLENAGIEWVKKVIVYMTPQLGRSHSHMFTREQIDPEQMVEVLVIFFRTALQTLAHTIKMAIQMRTALRLIFDEPEVLSLEESLAVRKRFTGTDVGTEGLNLNRRIEEKGVREDEEDEEDEEEEEGTSSGNKRKTNIKSSLGVAGPREQRLWVNWIDPLLKTKNQRDLGGQRNKEDKQTRRQRKERGDPVPKTLDDENVWAYSWGQVWLEDEYLSGPLGKGLKEASPFKPLPPGSGSVLIPDTTCPPTYHKSNDGEHGGVFRIRRIKVEGEDWRPAAEVLRPYMMAMTRPGPIKKH